MKKTTFFSSIFSKKALGLCFAFALCFTQNSNAQTPDFSCVGFATENGGTTGGTGGKIIDVSTAAELAAAIGTKKNGGQEPRIIRINGTINNGGKEIDIKECSNITFYGVGDNAFIEQTPLIITNSSNIIMRNIKFSMVGTTGGKDIIEITTTSSNYSRNIWIDHCEFFNETPNVAGANSNSIKDRYDGLLDIKKNSEYITISWCYFHDHYKAILVGFTTTDTVDRKITLHHNRFVRINSRIPSYRGGTAHIYNNYFEGWVENGSSQGNCIHTREGCALLIENNYFTKVNRAIYWEPADANEGFATGTGNYFASDVKSGFTSAAGTSPFVPPYGDVEQHDAMEIPELTLNYAGVGVITSYDDYGGGIGTNKAPNVTITSPQANQEFDAPANITVSADATDEDGSISKVEFYRDGTLVQTLTSAPYSVQFEGLTAASYTFDVKAYDDLNKFTTRSVIVSVKAPSLSDGESLFGSTASVGDYFWFNTTNKAVIEGVIADGAISGADFKPEEVVKDISYVGSYKIPAGGDAIFKLPSCTKFELMLSRTGTFSGNVYVSTNPDNWGSAVSSISGSKGTQPVDYTTYATSSSTIYVKIANSATGALHIHGAKIFLAKDTSSSIENSATSDKNIVRVAYYNLMGAKVNSTESHKVYIKETVYEDGSVERVKVLNSKK